MLVQWLDWQRSTVRAKCDGLSEADARRALIPSSPDLTVAGIVSHLTAVEHHWMERSFLGLTTDTPQSNAWHPVDELATLVERYERQGARSSEIALVHDLDDVEKYAPPDLPLVSLRWILGHLVQETARHAGHLDVLRELLDGQRGY